MAKNKYCRNSAEVTTENGEVTFVAARNVQNMNGITYDVQSLQAQNATGDYIVLTNEAQEVAIPFMVDHSSSVHNKIGTIDEAHIESADGVDQVVMHAVFFSTDEAQEIRQRVLESQLTDVSITTDYGTNMEVWEGGSLENGKIVEVSVVYAGAEPKAKILAKNSIDKEEDSEEKATELSDEDLEKIAEKVTNKLKLEKSDTVEKTETEINNSEEEEEEEEMATQKTNATTEIVADKSMVLNALVKLAQNGSIRGMNRSQVIEAIKNDVGMFESDGTTPYVIPDAVFTEILAITKPTDILTTFASVPAKKFTLMSEVPSEADLARAGRWSKGELKAIQASDLAAQRFATQFLYKMQELSYEDMQEDFGDLLYAYIRTELPQKVTEEEERCFIVGDGRALNNARHISSIVSLDAAAEDTANVHVLEYDGSADSSALEAITNGLDVIAEEGTTYIVMRKETLTALKNLGLSTASGLPFSEAQVAEALGVDRIFTRKYVAANTAYAYIGSFVKRLTGGGAGETIEQYDIDYNNQKIEFIRPVGGAAAGLASAVKIDLPVSISA